MENRFGRGECRGQRSLIGWEGGLEIGCSWGRRCVCKRGGWWWGLRWGELVLLKGRLLWRWTSVHVAAVLRPLWSAVVRVLELALVPPWFVTSGALRSAGLVCRCRLTTRVIRVLGEGRTCLTWGMRGSLGLWGFLPQAGVPSFQRDRSGGAAGWQSSTSCSYVWLW